MSSTGSGSVGIRFFIAGGEIVHRTFDQIAASGRKMWSEIANGQKSAVPGIRALNAASTEVKDSIASVASEAGSAGRVLVALGPAGIAAAVGLGAVVLSLGKIRESIEEISKVGDLAERFKLPTDTVQEYRYAIKQVGGEPGEADAALEAFSSKFGGARGGFKRDLLPFQELGFSKDDLTKFHDIDQVLKSVADKVANLRNPAEQSAIADKLGISSLLPVLRLGSEGLQKLLDKAKETGNVIDVDLIVRTKKLNDELSTLSGKISKSITGAFAAFGLTLTGVLTKIALVADKLGLLPASISKLLPAVDDLKSLSDLKGERDRLLASANGNGETSFFNGLTRVGAGILSKMTPGKMSEGLRSFAMTGSNNIDTWKRIAVLNQAIQDRQKAISAATGHDEDAHGKGHLIDVGGDAAAEQLKNAQQKRFDTALRAAQEKQLAAENDDTRTIEDRLQLSLRRIAMEKDSETTELARQVKAKELTDAQARQVAAAQDAARLAEGDALKRRADREKVQAIAAYNDEMAGYSLQLLQTTEQMTVILRDRLALQLQIYDTERARERSGLVARQALDANRTADQKRAELGGFDANTATGRSALLKQNNGLEQTVHDAFRNGVISGLQDGPLAAIGSFFDSLAHRFADKLADNVSDTLTAAFDGLVKYLADSIGSANPLGGGGGGDFFDGVGGFIADMFKSGGGKATGGGMTPGYAYRTAEHGTELALIGRSGQVFDHAATMDMLWGGGRGGGDTHVHANFSPVYNVQGNSDDIAALRQQMARDQASFRSRTISAVNDGHSRGLIDTRRK